jgi:hypothetical protein
MRLSESLVDLVSRSATPGKLPDRAQCESCGETASATELYALRCRHFHCAVCWEKQIAIAVELENVDVYCKCCETHDTAARTDLVQHLASEETARDFFANIYR